MSMLALNLAIYIEIMTLKFPTHFLILASIANIGKNICFLLASASRGKINMQFAKANNMGDISGKATSQFTTSSLLGMSLGIGLTQVINISAISQLFPTFMLLSSVSIGATYWSAAVIDEVHLNNQRANLAFTQFFETGRIGSCPEVNQQELFHVPNFLNWNRCSYIRFGERDVSKVLTQKHRNYYAKSVFLQLQKPERGFTYHVSFLKQPSKFIKKLTNNSRSYVIHLNLEHGSSN